MLHYDRIESTYTSDHWCRKPCKVFWSRLPVSCRKPWLSDRVPDKVRPTSLHRLALEFARSADSKAFDAKLRKSTEGYDVARDRASLREVCLHEETVAKDRCKVAEKANLISLSKAKYK